MGIMGMGDVYDVVVMMYSCYDTMRCTVLYVMM